MILGYARVSSDGQSLDAHEAIGKCSSKKCVKSDANRNPSIQAKLLLTLSFLLFAAFVVLFYNGFYYSIQCGKLIGDGMMVLGWCFGFAAMSEAISK